ncbi:hypothetical protein MAR_029097 [Mya arenaria]|uniref:Uncharacterized protein n=1 Tax=Mya arenaria TaxID=6604 RepID=A0ABY7DI72_MYAAR|nr:hypothetical protein MAR_029097 [Mya arenaria]
MSDYGSAGKGSGYPPQQGYPQPGYNQQGYSAQTTTVITAGQPIVVSGTCAVCGLCVAPFL